MPIIFLVSGTLFLVQLFNIKKSGFSLSQFLFIIMCLSLCTSYFFGDVVFGSISFNIFSLISILSLTILLVVFYKTNLSTFAMVFMISIIYNFMLETSTDYSFTFSKSLVLLILLFSMLYLFDFSKAINFITFSALILSFISSSKDLDSFGFSYLQLNFTFEIILAFVCLYVCANCIKIWCDIFIRRKNCETFKENVFNA